MLLHLESDPIPVRIVYRTYQKLLTQFRQNNKKHKQAKKVIATAVKMFTPPEDGLRLQTMKRHSSEQ